jgi:hypothetical protein
MLSPQHGNAGAGMRSAYGGQHNQMQNQNQPRNHNQAPSNQGAYGGMAGAAYGGSEFGNALHDQVCTIVTDCPALWSLVRPRLGRTSAPFRLRATGNVFRFCCMMIARRSLIAGPGRVARWLSNTTWFGDGLQLVQLAKESGSDSGISIQDCCSRLRQYSEAQIRYSPHAEEITMIWRDSDRAACPFSAFPW